MCTRFQLQTGKMSSMIIYKMSEEDIGELNCLLFSADHVTSTHCKIKVCYIPSTHTSHFPFPPRHGASDAIKNIHYSRPRRLSRPKDAWRQDTSKT